MPSLTQRLRTMFNFDAVRDSIQSLEGRLADIVVEINTLQAQRDTILNAPADRDDLRAAVERWVDQTAAGWTADLARTLRPIAIRPVVGDNVRRDLISVASPADPFSSGAAMSRADLDRLLCAMFRDETIASLFNAIDSAADWPAEGLPAANRPKAVEALEARLAELRAEEGRLREQAVSIGLNHLASY